MAAAKFERVSFAFNGAKVYDALFLKDKVPTYFVGCSATILKVIEKKAIPHDQFWFASYTAKNGYKECSADYKARRLLIRADWVEKNVPGFGAAAAGSAAHAAPVPKPARVYQPAPAILCLEDAEKFRDEAGNIVEVEVRGERHWKKIWFRARHVEKMLEMGDISAVVMHINSSYVHGKDYDTFSLTPLPVTYSEGDQKPQNKNQTAMFLSYSGLVRMLITRRHPIAERFQDWAFEKLFALQHGTKDQKEELVADVLGVTPKALKAVLSTNVSCMPAVYLFHLGSVKDLRQTLNIPDAYEDSATVYKFGRSDNLQRRTAEHEANYGRLPGVTLRLKHHVYIDPLYTVEAEADIRRYFANVDWILPHPQYTELAVVPAKLHSMVREKFVTMGKVYAGKLEELQNQLAGEKRMVEELKHQMQVQEGLHNALMREREERLKEKDQLVAAYKLMAEGGLRAPMPGGAA